MRTILLLACTVAGLFGMPAAAEDDVGPRLEPLAWLVGQWNRTGLPDGQSGYERWQSDGAGYSGVGVRLRGAQVAFEERLRIEADDGGVFYIAAVPGNPAPVRFRLTEQTQNAVAFENPNHDFPKRIAYRVDGDRLEALISADGREIRFGFERAADRDVHPTPTPTDTRPAMRHMINWFEIPATDFDRALRFYSTVLDAALEPMEMEGAKMGMLPSDGENVSGAIVQGEDYIPGTHGALVYLSGGQDLSPMLARVTVAGGRVIVPKTQISPEFGYFALFIDSEGNRVGLHSPN